LKLIGKSEFSQVFAVGEIVESGSGKNRKNAANLKILAIEDELVPYQSVNSAT
jgi:hypothetical protein